MAGQVLGILDWSCSCDEDGHRNFDLQWLVETSSPYDGPFVAMNASGLPLVGSYWDFYNDTDINAYCTPRWQMQPVLSRELNTHWIVTTPFTTKPRNRCADTTITNPLDEPMRIGGSFVKFTKEAYKNRHGKVLQSSSLEPITGPPVEFDNNKPTVTVGMNLLLLPLPDFAPLIDTVNSLPMWGLYPRMVKLSNAPWRREVYGTCNYYFTVDYELDIDFNTFDRKVPDMGTRHLPKDLDPDGIDPDTGKAYKYSQKKYIAYREEGSDDRARCFLDGNGRVLADGDDHVDIDIEYYPEADLFTLGLPANFYT